MYDKKWQNNAVLIYGARKSGTTLLQNLLDGGEEILVFPNEIKLKQFLKRVWKNSRNMVSDYIFNNQEITKLNFKIKQSKCNQKAVDVDDKSFNLLFAKISDCVNYDLLDSRILDSLDYKNYLSNLKEFNEHRFNGFADVLRKDITIFYNNLYKKPDKIKMWAMKEVGGDPETIFGFFKTMFPNGKIVAITRNPYYVIRSIIRDRRRRKGIQLSPVYIAQETYMPLELIGY